MNSDSSTVKKAVSLYIERSFQTEIIDNETEIKNKKYVSEARNQSRQIEKEINTILPKIVEMVQNPKDFIKTLKQIEKQEKERFQLAFAGPVIEDFINILIFDLKRKKFIDDSGLERLRKAYKANKITIHF